MSRTARWVLASVFVLAAGMLLPFFAVYSLTVWLMPEHHDLSDLGIGLYGLLFGAVAAIVGVVITAWLAARWVGSKEH